ncbi:response regulator [Fredinandcohnia humi]
MMPEHIEKEFEQLLLRFLAVYSWILQDKLFEENEVLVKDLYLILKKIQSYSAIYHFQKEFHISTFLLSAFQVSGSTYHLTKQKALLVKRNLKILFSFLSGWKDDYSADGLKSITTLTAPILTDNVEYLECLINQFAENHIELILIEPSSVKVELLSQNHSTLFLDMSLTDANQICKQIRANSLLSNTYIIGFHSDTSAQGNSSHFDPILDMYLQHPYSFSSLRTKLEMVKEKHQHAQKKYNHSILRKEWVRFQRFNHLFSLILIQIEPNLRADKVDFVDMFAHIYEIYQACLRVYDEILLWNPFSFIVLLPATPIESAKLVIDRINKAIHKKGFESIKFTIGLIQSEHHYADIIDMVTLLENEAELNTGIKPIFSIPLQEQEFSMNQSDIRYKLLIIDDDPIPPVILQNYLGTDEWDIQICQDGANAIDFTLQWRPDVIICESKFLNFDGFFFCSQVRQNPILKDLGILFLSSQMLNNHVVRGLKVGADDYIVKPFSAEEVGERIRRVLRIKRTRRL